MPTGANRKSRCPSPAPCRASGADVVAHRDGQAGPLAYQVREGDVTPPDGRGVDADAGGRVDDAGDGESHGRGRTSGLGRLPLQVTDAIEDAMHHRVRAASAVGGLPGVLEE